MTDTTNIITKDNDKFISDNIKLKNQSSLRYPNDKIVREDLLNVLKNDQFFKKHSYLNKQYLKLK